MGRPAFLGAVCGSKNEFEPDSSTLYWRTTARRLSALGPVKFTKTRQIIR
jgi:hypothetical protein